MNVKHLPVGYRPVKTVDLTEDKKRALVLNAGAIIIMIFILISGLFISPIKSFEIDGIFSLAVKIAVVILGVVLYVILHELIHGIAIKLLTGTKPFYGVTKGAAFAGTECFLDRKTYILIALAPLVVLTISLGIISLNSESGWFWLFHILQSFNIGGCIGDIYVMHIIMGFDKDVLVFDKGSSMTFYERERT